MIKKIWLVKYSHCYHYEGCDEEMLGCFTKFKDAEKLAEQFTNADNVKYTKSVGGNDIPFYLFRNDGKSISVLIEEIAIGVNKEKFKEMLGVDYNENI